MTLSKYHIVPGLLVATVAFCLAGSLQAAGEEEGMSGMMQKQTSLRADELIGRDVTNPQGEELGKVSDLMLDQYGRARYLIVSHGGIMGMGGKLVAVPWQAFSITEGPDVALNITRQQLTDAPTIKRGEWPDLADSSQVTRINQYFVSAGVIGEAQLASARPSFTAIDLDGNGKITRNEVQQISRLGERFNQVDRNNDGNVNEAEFAAFEFETEEPGGM